MVDFATLAAAMVLPRLLSRRFRPTITVPAYLEAMVKKDGPKVRVAGAAFGSDTEYVTACLEVGSYVARSLQSLLRAHRSTILRVAH